MIDEDTWFRRYLFFSQKVIVQGQVMKYCFRSNERHEFQELHLLHLYKKLQILTLKSNKC